MTAVAWPEEASHYELETKLGAGGMGEVWRARHRLLARPAAIKLVRLDSPDQDPERHRMMISRFEREAQATARMCSPHTIQLYDFGVEEGGTFYYAMELLQGLDLDALVTRFGPLLHQRAVCLLLQICDSLGEAHERGLIHRDIKPANIYICHYGRRYDFVKVLDFGLVKSFNDGGIDATKLTTEFSIGGTPGFIAPEQVLGEEIDARADIYSLGCVAYWMLTGRHVFEARKALQVMMMHVRETPARPSLWAEENIPEALDAVVLSCLEKDPFNRPQSVDQLAAALAGCSEGTEWSQAQSCRWWGKHLSEY